MSKLKKIADMKELSNKYQSFLSQNFSDIEWSVQHYENGAEIEGMLFPEDIQFYVDIYNNKLTFTAFSTDRDGEELEHNEHNATSIEDFKNFYKSAIDYMNEHS